MPASWSRCCASIWWRCVRGSICCPAPMQRAFVDIDSLLRPVYGHAKQGASYGHTKIAGKQVLRKGLSPLATTISTDTAAPVIAGMRLRAGQGQLGQGCGAHGRPGHRHRPRRRGQRADPGARRLRPTAPARWWPRAAAPVPQFSLVLTKNTAVQAAIDAIDEDAWTPVRYPGAVRDPDTGAWISDAEVAEIAYTAFASTPTPVTARLIVRRVKDARYRRRAVPGVALSPVLHQLHRAGRRRRHHPPPPRHHRNHLRRPDRRTAGPHALGALRRQLGLDPVRGDRPQPAARRRRSWPEAATPQHAGRRYAAGLVNIPARLARPQREPILHLPTHWPWATRMAYIVAQHHRTTYHARASLTTRRKARTGTQQEKLGRPADTHAPHAQQSRSTDHQPTDQAIGGSRLSPIPFS